MLGFVLLLFGASPHAHFAEWFYPGLQDVMVPFRGLFEPVRQDGRSVLNVSNLFAIVHYEFGALRLHAVIDWLTARIIEMRVDDAPAHGRASTL